MKLSPAEARRRFTSAPVARLATAGADGRPHLVPVTFAVEPGTDTLWFAVDDKPKASVRLRRLANIRADPRVCLLADHYEDDWTALWWARADGEAEVGDSAAGTPAVELLRAKYPPYADRPPAGPVVAVRVGRWSGWSYE
jgi:PPOX class probable F420-dependent enzyme